MPEKAIVYGNIVDPADRQRLQEFSRGPDCQVVWIDTPSIFESFDEHSTVFVDLDNPAFVAADFLLSIATAGERVTMIGKSEQPTVDQALKVSKLGITEILTPDQCLDRLDRLLKDVENIEVEADPIPTRFSAQALIGVSPQMNEIRKTIKVLAEVDFPSALILGETGTGKSLISKVLHNAGLRSDHNLVEVNCSAIPDELFESELFGHVKGAFTDAKQDKAGLFEYAEGGTLFLDEVGNLSGTAQAKLLKILEDKKLRKVGAVDEKDINVRVVTATNLDLSRAISNGTFREDLYYRLNLLTIRIPPLRERPEDIQELAEYYLGYYATNYGKPGVALDDEAMALINSHTWPGNVRELCNVIERAVLLSRSGRIRPRDIQAAVQSGRLSIADRNQFVIDFPPQGISLQEIEQHVVKQVLNLCNWNKTETAKLLRISRPRLRRIIESAGLEQNRRKSE